MFKTLQQTNHNHCWMVVSMNISNLIRELQKIAKEEGPDITVICRKTDGCIEPVENIEYALYTSGNKKLFIE